MASSRIFQAAALSLIFLAAFGQAGVGKIQPTTPSLGVSDRLQQSWGQYAPYFPADKYQAPSDCTITQVNILQRHGGRWPTSSAGAKILQAVQKLQKATIIHEPDLKFVKTYKYMLGAEDLVPYGASQSFDAGQEVFERYPGLVSKDQPPFVRASSSSRVVFSATNWTAGFVKASRGSIHLAAPLVLNEAANDTLDDSMCPNAGGSDPQTTAWQNTFAPPIVARLNAAAPGANLTNADIPSLLSLCAFETVANERPSPWCKVFPQDEFDDFEFSGDLDKYYNTGYGQPLGPVQGVGYINELIARLTGKPVKDSTQTNRTLDSSPKTFPLDRSIYADFSHDNQMIAIYAAMGIERPAVAPNPTKPDPRRKWLASRLVPFSAKLVIERLQCKYGGESVRMLLEDQIVSLPFCGARQDGICKLDAFVESQAYARHNGNGDFEKCFT